MGEVTLLLAGEPKVDATFFSSALAAYPLAVLSVGGWGVVLTGLGTLALGPPQTRPRLLSAIVVYLGVGALLGGGLAAVLTMTRAASSDSYLFETWSLFLAGVCGGLAGSAASFIWQVVAAPSNKPYMDSSRMSARESRSS